MIIKRDGHKQSIQRFIHLFSCVWYSTNLYSIISKNYFLSSNDSNLIILDATTFSFRAPYCSIDTCYEKLAVLVNLARWEAIVFGEGVRGIGFNQAIYGTHALPIFITFHCCRFKAYQLIVALRLRLARWSITSC